MISKTTRMALSATALTLIGGIASADQVILDDLIVDGSICVGLDCVNGESFGFDTLRLKENNLRQHFQDTSTSASFPSNDWRIVINDSSNGGGNYFAVEDSDAARQPFRVEAGARVNALYVRSNGKVGFGTATPVGDLHVKTGNTPTLRLEQDGSAGFGAQVWDVAGNETNFFVRDATNGSTLPFRIFPGAPASALHIAGGTGNIGLGTASPDGPLHIRDDSVYITLDDANDNDKWFITHQAINDGNFELTSQLNGGTPNVALKLTPAGIMTITGGLVTGTAGSCTLATPCDAVFDPALYSVPSIEEHAAVMWQNKYLPAVGPTDADMPINVSERVLTMLNELEHAHIYIEQLNAELKTQSAENEAVVAALTARLERLEESRAE